MELIQTLFVAVALAMDCLTVSLACGVAARHFRPWPMTTMMVAFGLFQGGMTAAGALGGTVVSSYLHTWGDWISFGLLMAVGITMIHEGLHHEESGHTHLEVLGYRLILALAVATSIDALAVGVSMALVGTHSLLDLALTCTIIGLTSTAFTAAGLAAGILLGRTLKYNITPIGGIILMGIGIRIIIQHFI